jgi:hypothetical protein
MYLGTYNNSVVIFGLELAATRAGWSEEIEGHTFNYSNGYRIWVWNDGSRFHQHEGLFDLGSAVAIKNNGAPPLLRADDIAEIHRLFNEQYHNR